MTGARPANLTRLGEIGGARSIRLGPGIKNMRRSYLTGNPHRVTYNTYKSLLGAIFKNQKSRIGKYNEQASAAGTDSGGTQQNDLLIYDPKTNLWSTRIKAVFNDFPLRSMADPLS